METKGLSTERRLEGLSLIIAPVLFSLSSFYWVNGEYGVIGGTILMFSLIFWISAIHGLFGLIREKYPVYAYIGFLLAVYGCISGASFGLVGVFSEIFNISHDQYLADFANYPISTGLILFWSGPLFPLSLLVLGIVLMLNRSVHWFICLLICLGAIAFPLSRIPRIPWIAHLADLLLLIPMIYIGFGLIKTNSYESLSTPDS